MSPSAWHRPQEARFRLEAAVTSALALVHFAAAGRLLARAEASLLGFLGLARANLEVHGGATLSVCGEIEPDSLAPERVGASPRPEFRR